VSSHLDLMRVSPKGYEPLLDVAFDHRTALVASALGPPPPALIERAHGAGVAVAALAGTVVHAERHKAAGVDVIVAQGTEAGGHTGEIATMVLVPDVVDAVAPTPVLAAGGIASGRQIAAAMALGAEGVWCGSVWLTTAEAETHPVVKQKFVRATSRDTVRSRSLTGKPARMLRSAWTEEWERADAPPTLAMPLQGALVAEAQTRIARSAASNEGAEKLSNYFVGQVVGRMDAVKPARQVLLDMVTEYADVVERFAQQAAGAAAD
jgi:NAD(P)H-dependent flavin oxidoreductase YrpB (nitropropane dioxygenase family)